MTIALILLAAFICGSIPFSYLVAQAVAKTDLREVGSGTVSGTGLYQVAGFYPLALGGILDVAKALPALLFASHNQLLAAFALALTVAGHNWSPFIGGHGGRGISPALGGFLVVAWPGTLLLLGGLGIGRLLRQTGLVVFLTLLFLPWLLLSSHGPYAHLAGWLVLLCVCVKRALGNSPLPAPGRQRRWRARLHRLVFDNDDHLNLEVGGAAGAVGLDAETDAEPDDEANSVNPTNSTPSDNTGETGTQTLPSGER